MGNIDVDVFVVRVSISKVEGLGSNGDRRRRHWCHRCRGRCSLVVFDISAVVVAALQTNV
jgi:hypothetical protein